jgi:carboxylesterase type B
LKPIADAILHAYKFTPNSETQALYRGLIQFLSDAIFGLPVHEARRSLTSSNNTPKEHPTTVQSYRVEYTNPFPGLLQSLAHHCIDLLYIFDAFHVDLAKTNEQSNQDLVVAMQTHWIDFIWDGCKPETSKWGVRKRR